MIEIIIPAYNEEKRIAAMLQSYLDYYKDRVSFYVVINGTTDNTEEVIKKFPQIKYVNIKEAIGKGAAVIEGWKNSQAEVVGFVDADAATPPEEFDKLIKFLENNKDYKGAIASRFLPGAEIRDRKSQLRSVMSRAYIFFVRLFFGMPFIDTQCGAKLFYRDFLKEVINEMQTGSMAFDVELLWKLNKQGVKIKEIPTIWIDKEGSAKLGSKTSFLKEGFKMVLTLLKIRFGK